MRVVIIEDEPLVAKDLAATIKKIRPDFEIQCILGSVAEAVAYFRSNPQPHLIFSDIQLGDGLSFEITKEVRINVPIIFCTAYDEYAIDAFKTNGIEYILKPAHPKALENAISKFENLKESLAGDIAKQYDIAMKTLSMYKLKESGTYMARYRDRFLPINIDAIAYFFLENEVNHLYTHKGMTYYVTESLEELEKRFAPVFFRVNRQFLINRNAIAEASEYFPRRLKINLKVPFENEIIVSKEKRAKVLDWLSSQLI